MGGVFQDADDKRRRLNVAKAVKSHVSLIQRDLVGSFEMRPPTEGVVIVHGCSFDGLAAAMVLATVTAGDSISHIIG
jgi:hypothetical protein